MFKSKYSNFLTILLVILIIAIISGIIFIGYRMLNKKDTIDDALAMFDNAINDDNNSNNIDDGHEIDFNSIAPNKTNSESGSSKKRKVEWNGFIIVGRIKIPKTSIDLPIIERGTDAALRESVAIMYPENAQLNTLGNVVIMGHNYRNNKMFSNNKKLSTGDKVIITDIVTGQAISYTIYEKFETDENDTSFITRDTEGKMEISLSTCTDESNGKRLIILARADV